MPKHYSLQAEVFAVGTWNGMEFTREDLQSIAAAFNSLRNVHKVPLKMGHNDEQPFTDGQPALGWVTDVWVQGDILMTKFDNMPEVVFTAMQAGLYKHVSVELDVGVEHNGNYYPYVLSGVALLGADIPAVNTIKDLQAYMGKELKYEARKAFTADLKFQKLSYKGEVMSDELNELKEQVAMLNKKLKQQEVEFEKATSENIQLKKQLIEMKAEYQALESLEGERKLREQRELLEKDLDQMVKDRKLAPYSRDEWLRDYDEAQDKKTVMYAVEKLKRTMDTNPQYFGAEQARKLAERQRDEADKDPSAIVANRTREYMSKHGEKNFAVAKTAVLKADPELADRYVKGGV